jgi:N-acetyl-anhydromuramyl-L-alanine amidase AmpD
LPALWAIKQRAAKCQERRTVGVDTIVLHDTESLPNGNFDLCVKYLADPVAYGAKKKSIHYLIGRDSGQIVAMVPEDRQAYHVVGYNDRSIGIELYKKTNDHGDFTEWQYSAVAQLVCDIRLRWGLPQSSVTSHDVLSVPKKDPRNFNWASFEARVKALFLRLRLIDPSLTL